MKVTGLFLLLNMNLGFSMGDPTFIPAPSGKQEQEEIKRSKNGPVNPKQTTSRSSRNKKAPRKIDQNK
jgi:hypothetical protein